MSCDEDLFAGTAMVRIEFGIRNDKRGEEAAARVMEAERWRINFVFG